MKYMWRVTKYNPLYRDDEGVYLKDEWTSYNDIGKSYNGVKLSMSEYEKYEKLYIDSALLFMECNGIENLRINELEKYDYERNNEIICNIKEGMILDKEQIKVVIQYILREKIWCKLVIDKVLYVHFGYDYNMYIGSNKKCENAIRTIENSNMFVESFRSPYLEIYD